MAFIVDTGNQLNDTELARIKKMIKELQKKETNNYIDIALSYESGSSVASDIKVEKSDTIDFAETLQLNYTDNCLGITENKQRKLLSGIRYKKDVFHGSIDGKYPIVMNFNLLGNKEIGEITGDYFYPKFGNTNRMTIKGSYKNNNFVFDEFDDAGKKYGYFKGTISGKKISGKFIKNGKEMPFSMDSN